MKTTPIYCHLIVIIWLVVLAFPQTTTQAAEFFLRADLTTLTMPDGVQIPVWGFALDSAFGSLDGQVMVPGPRLVLEPGDSILIIHLDNNLPEPVSLVIPGQYGGALTPVRATDGRIRSFAPETEPYNTIAGTYTWTNVRPGTFLYQSGAHVAVQVQMGLYGAVTKDYAAGQAYSDPELEYDRDLVLVLSELDPVLHEAIAAGTYGAEQAISSTVDYAPRYFLVNGQAYQPAVAPIPLGVPGESVLIRFINAGLKSHAPIMPNQRFLQYTEDANLLPFPKDRHYLLLPAGQTQDVKLELTEPGYFPIYDRAMGVTNHGEYPGGMLVYLQVQGAQQRTLHTVVKGSGRGRIIGASMPGGLDCDSDCTVGYNDGTTILIRAVPEPGSIFTGWTNLACTSPECTVTLTADLTVLAQFELVSHRIGTFSNGEWNLDLNGDGTWQVLKDGTLYFGQNGDKAVVGDWNGDGYDEIGVFSNGTWKLDLNGDGRWNGSPTDKLLSFGAVGDTPIVGDWNGDGVSDIGVYKAGSWRIDRNANGMWDDSVLDARFTFGHTGALPIVGDWNADGKDEIGSLVRGVWSLDLNGNGIWDGATSDRLFTFGQKETLPVVGDWNSDGVAGIGTSLGGTWFIDANENEVWDGSPLDKHYTFGSAYAVPVSGNWPDAYTQHGGTAPRDPKFGSPAPKRNEKMRW